MVEAFRSESLPDLPDARVEDDFGELHRAIEALEVERLRRLAEIERRRTYARDGYLSAAAWLAATQRVGWGQARESVRTARSLCDMPRTHQALEAGDISMSAAKVLAEARRTDPAAFARSEDLLVEAAQIHSMHELHRVVGSWRAHAERERDLRGEDVAHARRRLHASSTYLGMVRVDGDLDVENGEALLTALRAVMDAGVHASGEPDARTPAQRRADALGEICRQWLDRSDRPTVGGERPHLTVTMSADDLTDDAPGAGAFDHAGPVATRIVRRLACDASITRVVLSARSEPLDVGRRTPVVPPAMRRAVIVRDRSCRFPRCDRPHTWCDAHHIVHWADGGVTALSNLILLCRRHHRMAHDRFRVQLEEGRPVFLRPDDTMIEDRAPP